MADFYRTVDTVTKASIVPGVCLNVMLIYLINTCSHSQIGTFRYLLIVFASYDILLVVLHYFLDPKSLVLPGVFSIVLDIHHGSKALTCLHYILFMVSYAILITHLLYRYWVIHKPYNVQLFSDPRFIMKLIAFVAGMVAMLIGISLPLIEPDNSEMVTIVRAEFNRRFGRDIEHGWAVASYWKDGRIKVLTALAVLVYDVVGASIVIVVCFLASATYRHIHAAFGLSPATRRMQMQLLTMVCVQTFIPMVCVMLPYFCNMTLPIFGVTLSIVTETTGLMMSLFPSWDPLAAIMLMKPYRDGLRALLVPCTPNATPATMIVSQTSVMIKVT